MSLRTVLIIDDDAEFRSLLGAGLQAAGHAVLTARNGEEAKTAIRTQHVDLAIVDGLLPDGDGSTWVAWLRKSGHRTPVAFVSAFRRDTPHFRRLMNELQIGLVLRKPIMVDLAVPQLEQLMGPPPTIELPEEEPNATLDAEIALEALRQSYAQSLPGKIRDLATVLNRARAHAADDASLAEARSQAHRLRGTAGSFGYSALGEAAGHIEDALVTMEEQPDRRSSLFAVVTLALRELVRLAGEAAGAPVPNTEVEAAPVTPSPAPAPEPFTPPPAATSTATETLLIVDDDPDFLRYAAELARQHFLTPILATTSTAAITKARETRPDAALLDVNLGPDELSFRLVHELRTLPGLEQLPVGFMSAEQRFDNRVAAAYAGATNFLTKPVDPTAFGVAVRHLLSAAQRERPSILLVESDHSSANRTVAALQAAEMRVRVTASGKEVPQLIADLRPDLLLLSTKLDDMNAYDLCRALRMDAASQDLPVVFLATFADPTERLSAYHAGGDDLLLKPVVEEELQTRIRNLVDRARLRSERASLDPLTGLQLRGAFLRELASLGLAHRPVVVALLDLDGITTLNERRGFAAGDRAIAALGRQVRRSFMSDVIRGRWGDDEIALAFPGEDLETVTAVMRRVQKDFASTTLLDRSGVGFQISFSAGLAASPADGENSEELMRIAERRLRTGRASGAGTITAGTA